jgi:hypothetical protein
VTAALVSSRPIAAYDSNWKLFATTVEVFLHQSGSPRDNARLMEGIDKHRTWSLGDGVYGDGPEFHWDYYNSFVIQPMFVEALDVIGTETPELQKLRDLSRARLTRWAEIQERLIAPDGTYPVTGRSIAYRCGAFQGLAQAALRHALPPGLAPAQVRVALTSVIRRTLEAPGTWDASGWLQIGLAGHQPGLGETYISTGSLYLSAVRRCSRSACPRPIPSGPIRRGPRPGRRRGRVSICPPTAPCAHQGRAGPVSGRARFAWRTQLPLGRGAQGREPSRFSDFAFYLVSRSTTSRSKAGTSTSNTTSTSRSPRPGPRPAGQLSVLP